RRHDGAGGLPDRRARHQRDHHRARPAAAGRGPVNAFRGDSQAVPGSLQRRRDRAAREVLVEVRAQLRVTAALAALSLVLAGCSLGAPRPSTAKHSPSPSPSHSAAPSAAPQPPNAAWPQFLGSAARFGIGFSSPALDSIKPEWTAALDGAEYGEPLVAFGQAIAATENDT